MIVNPLFNKSSKGLNPIFKNEQKNWLQTAAILHKKPKLQTFLKGTKYWMFVKAMSQKSKPHHLSGL